MNPPKAAAADAWHAHPVDRTSQTDDQRIKDITVLPPPEHLIRFFPIRGTAVESLISTTRRTIHNIMAGQDDRLLVDMYEQLLLRPDVPEPRSDFDRLQENQVARVLQWWQKLRR